MEYSKALGIIQCLADGVDPRSGECFAADSAYQDPQTIRALAAAVRALQHSVEIERRRRSLPGKVGSAWSTQDEATLASEFDAGKNIAELARQLERTVGAVRARLVKLGKIEDEGMLYSPYQRGMSA